MQALQDLHAQRERDAQVMVDRAEQRVLTQQKERDDKVRDMQEKMAKMIGVHTQQLEAQRKSAALQREKERQEREKEKADREEEKKKRKAEVEREKRELQDAYNKKVLDIMDP